MEKKSISPKRLRQRKLMAMIPVLILPFITLFFWALGGGKTGATLGQSKAGNGFNMQLPDAKLKDDKPWNKMSYYNQALSDSIKLEQMIKNDPNYQRNLNSENSSTVDHEETSPPSHDWGEKRGFTSQDRNDLFPDTNEEKIYRKLAELDKAMNKVGTPTIEEKEDPLKSINVKGRDNTSLNTQDIDRLEQMIQSMNQPRGQDPEMQRLNNMLEKILDIQHPERVRQQLKEKSLMEEDRVFAVSATGGDAPFAFLDSKEAMDTFKDGFYSLEEPALINESQNAAQSAIYETATIVNGSTIKFRLLDDIYINGMLIPRNNFLFGTAELTGERLFVKISSIRYHNSLFPVRLSVYDMDGMEGIYIPGAITRDAAKQSSERAIQSIGMSTLDPSIGAQAAEAAVEAARNLLSKKVKLVKVTLKGGYRVLLKDEKQKMNPNRN